MKFRTILLTFITLSIMPQLVFADYISGVTATTDMGAGFATDLQNTVNGVGLSSLSLNATHDGTVPNNSWVSSFSVLTGTVTFDLGMAFLVDRFAFWNQNGGGPGAAGSTGINGVQVFYSPDGTTFLPLPGGPASFAQVPGNTALPPETFTFAPVSAKAFRFAIGSNWGDPDQTGFAEVAFNNVPEPGTIALCLLGLGVTCLGSRRRWRKR